MENTKTRIKSEDSAPSEQAVLAEKVLKSMTKLVNGRRIYAENNPRLEQFRQEFESALARFFENEDELVLTVDQYSMRWQDHTVYENTKREDSLAFALFKDGIGEVTIQPSAIGRDTNTFVDILADEILNAGDEDVVTRLWNADFQHITYRVLDDYLSDEFGRGAANDTSENRHDETSDHPELLPSMEEKGRVFVDRATALRSIDEFLRAALTEHHPEGDDRQREALYQRSLRTNFTIPAEEIALYTRELERERAEDGISAFTETMLVFTLLPDNPSAVRDVMAIIDRLVDYAVSEKNAGTLARLLSLARDFGERPDLTDEAKAYLDTIKKRVADGAVLAKLMEGLTGPGPATTAVLEYARQVGTGAIEPLTRALHGLEGTALHRQFCDTLIAIAGESLAESLERFDIDNPQVAIDVVYIARALEVQKLTPRLRELVFYPDPRVKLEMIEWISARSDSESTHLLLESLADLDKRVRLRVLAALAERPEQRVREKVAELAFGKDLGDRAADEQEVIFRTLGRVGDARIVEQIRAMVEKRRLIPIGKGNDSKLLAIRALERIRDPAALDVLSRLAEDANEAVRLRALRARDTLTAALKGSPSGGETA